jgi:aldehyde dehydrogenase (NAD+)
MRANMSGLSVELTAPNGRKYTQPLGLFINNEWVKSSDGEKITSINPTYLIPQPHPIPPPANSTISDESEIASVYAASAADVDAAVKAARKAFHDPAWKDMTPTDRGMLLVKLAQLVEENAETLATIETWDNGKPYSVALSEDLSEVSGVFRYYGGYADKIHGQVIDVGPAKFAYTIREPLGVCGQIIP